MRDTQRQVLEDMLQQHDAEMKTIQVKIDALRWRARSTDKCMPRKVQLSQAKQDLNVRRVLHDASMVRSWSAPPECSTSSSSTSSQSHAHSPRIQVLSNPPTSAVNRVLSPLNAGEPHARSPMLTSSVPRSTPRTP